MPQIDVERKRKTAWPWIAGVAALALILVGVTALLTEDADAEPRVTVPTVEDTHPPAAVPSPPDLDPEATGVAAARGLGEVAPLGEEDVGQVLRLDGQVVATGNEAFWILTGGNVVRVDSPRRVRKGDTLSIEGTLHPANPETTDLIAADVLSRHPDSSEWTVVRVLKLVEDDGQPSGGDAETPRPEA